jgi:hypothetical protein
MYKSIIFIDFESLQKINADLINNETKLIVMVGLNQDEKAFGFAKKLFNDISSMELIKVNGRGHNALDIFIAYYLGLYFDNIKDSEIIICSNDSDYDQLIKHLNGYGISIKRVDYTEIINTERKMELMEKPKGKIAPQKTVAKVVKSTDNIQTIIDYLKNQTVSQKKARPKKITTLEKYLHTHFSKKVSLEIIKQVIELMKRNKNIIITTYSTGCTAPNRTVCASGPYGPSASAMARSFRYASFPRHCSGTVCRPWKCCAFPYSGRQTVIYSRNVMRNTTLKFSAKKILTNVLH